MWGPRRLSVVVAVLAAIGLGAVALPSGSRALGTHKRVSPTCRRSQLRLGARLAAAQTQSILLGVYFINESGHACTLYGQVSMTIQQDVNGQWQTAKIARNTKGYFVKFVLPGGHHAYDPARWLWVNWCGAVNMKLRLFARYRLMQAASKPLAAEPLPACGDSSIPSTLMYASMSVR